jgi:CO/xanthine dehydrogenase Mo-binding subunit
VTLVQALATGLAVGWGLRAGQWMTDAITGAVLAAVANLRRRDSMRSREPEPEQERREAHGSSGRGTDGCPITCRWYASAMSHGTMHLEHTAWPFTHLTG